MAEMMLGFECPHGFVDHYADCENINKPECVKCRDKAKLISDTMNGLFVGKWISVKDKLPEKQGFYLCVVGASWMPVRIMEYRPYGIYENERLWVTVGADVNHYVHDWFVHAWMPLPELPKEG